MKQGKFIVFEGLDGSGKTTQLERLGARLTEKLGTNAVYCTREPGDSAPGILCQQFSQKKLALAPETVALLYAADRVEHIAKDLLPRLEAGQTVLCDRYYFSNFAYQTLTSDLEDLLRYNAFARRTLRPDAVVFVDVDPEECARRRAHRGGAAEFYEKTELARQIRTGYRQVFDRLKTEEHILTVDGSGQPDQVEARIWSALQGYFESGVNEEITQP